MKVVIDIDDELVETAKFAVRLDMGSDYVKSIANGIPLDKIRAEIEALNEKVSVDYKMCLDKSAVLQIIDKYKESEEV
jgi:hypothetical protein